MRLLLSVRNAWLVQPQGFGLEVRPSLMKAWLVGGVLQRQKATLNAEREDARSGESQPVFINPGGVKTERGVHLRNGFKLSKRTDPPLKRCSFLQQRKKVIPTLAKTNACRCYSKMLGWRWLGWNMLKYASVTVLFVSLFGFARCAPEPLSESEIQLLYQEPPVPLEKPLAVFHIGHSLVARDMPAMLAQMAGNGHSYESQLGWGTSLRAHWDFPGEPLNGGDVENNHPRYREAREALASGDYDVLVLTESVEIRSAIKYHHSWDYMARWIKAALAGNPDIRIYLYESWHKTNDPEGWFHRVDRDLGMYWEREILNRAQAVEGAGVPVYLIPAGQVMARFLREVELLGGVEGIKGIDDLFSDNIHVNDLGFYLVALTHYAVIYGSNPVDLPRQLVRADGTPANAPSEEAAALMKRIVWDVVTTLPRTGVTGP